MLHATPLVSFQQQLKRVAGTSSQIFYESVKSALFKITIYTLFLLKCATYPWSVRKL